MKTTYAIVIDTEMEIHTIRVANTTPEDQRIGMFNLAEWLGSTALGRYEFAPDVSIWFTQTDEPLNIVGTALLDNRVAIKGTVAITTWTKRGIDSEGLSESQIPEVWGWLEEIVAFNKMYMDTHDLTLEQRRTQIEGDIYG